MSETLTLHHLEYSQSFRVLWMLEELGLPYELIVYSRDARTMRHHRRRTQRREGLVFVWGLSLIHI